MDRGQDREGGKCLSHQHCPHPLPKNFYVPLFLWFLETRNHKNSGEQPFPKLLTSENYIEEPVQSKTDPHSEDEPATFRRTWPTIQKKSTLIS